MKKKPFLLKPAGKDYLWGGTRLNDEFEKNIDMTPLAETWECSMHPDGQSVVGSGEFEGRKLGDVITAHPEFLGSRHPDGELPILIKFIDAKSDLSLQVHPDDEYARINENGQRGKTEMWYVLDASKDSSLIYGLRHDLEEKELLKALEDGTVIDHVRRVKIRKDDIYYVEPGTLHAIGAGALVAEIQESSNLTYRMYDYDRVDKDGKKRPLHIKKGMEVASLKSSVEPRQPMRVLKYSCGVAAELLCRCKYFEVFRMIINTERRQKVMYASDELSYRVLLCVNGCGTLSFANEALNFYKGDCVFVPADSEEMYIHGKAVFLDVRG